MIKTEITRHRCHFILRASWYSNRYMNHSNSILLSIFSFFIGILVFPNLLIAQTLLTDKDLAKKVQQMSLEQKVGQLFILGFSQDTLTPELALSFKHNKPGAFVLFKRNISSLDGAKKLNQSLHALSMKYSGFAPIIAVDQEGGSVVRISTSPPMPNALSVGQAGSTEIAEGLGQESASVLSGLGFNMNLAPVLDIANPLEFSFIGVRSYGSDPTLVGKMGYAYSKGLILGRVVPTGKHFPGTGSSSFDPHHESSTILSTKDVVYKTHLPPFQSFSKLGFFTALMVSHSIYPSLDETKTPAVFSKAIMTDLLRKKMKYRGLVITDDLQMSASRSFLRPEEAALKSLLAGSDMVMLTWSAALQAKAIARVKSAVKSGELPMALLDEKVFRIARVKKYLTSPIVENRKLASKTNVIKSEKLRGFDDEILVANLRAHLNSVEKSHKSLCLLSPSKSFMSSFKSGYGEGLQTKAIARKTTANEIATFVVDKHCDLLVYTVEGRRTSAILKQLPQKLRAMTLVANMSLPVYVSNSDQYRVV